MLDILRGCGYYSVKVWTPLCCRRALERQGWEWKPTGCLLTLNWDKVTQHRPVTAWWAASLKKWKAAISACACIPYTSTHAVSEFCIIFFCGDDLAQKKKKKIHSVHRKCKISHRALGVAERELAVDASSYGSAVNSNSLALLLQGSGHFELQSLCTVCVRLC